ncbi:ABC transporter ATP-binding protein [Halorubrum sodomense]|uniref:ABC-2 type transport system ATP-binding protein n=1 Tax=Halorubrum sodomense TaxID=35743 RepID=A0A1I6H6K1_HALSD|nr:ABC transporter ATP-binding protein [Halorubrum sodomense]SFR49931.1 ABC-2 type transport system ATP-binding protein [Halorubrum sodomense]
MPAIECRDLSKYYGDVRGVEDVSFTVEEGEVFGFLGPNGAGKTTAIRTLLGFLSPTSGGGTLLGHDVTDPVESRRARERIGYLPSDPGLDRDRTAAAFLDHQAALRGESSRDGLVDRFDLDESRRIADLSRGNRQKVALVAAFMHDPDLLLLDEPTSGLDPLLQEEFAALVRERVDDGASVLLSSHVLGEVAALCDRVGVLRDGHLAAVESVSDLRSRGGKQVRVRVAEDVDRDDFEVRGAMNLRVGETVSFTWTGEYDALIDLLSGYTVLDLDVVDAPLEEAFMTFYDGDVPGPSGGGGPRPTGSGGSDASRDATAGSGGDAR